MVNTPYFQQTTFQATQTKVQFVLSSENKKQLNRNFYVQNSLGINGEKKLNPLANYAVQVP